MKKNKPKDAKDQMHAKQGDEHGDKESTKRHVYIEPGAQIDLVQDLKKEYKSSNTQASTYNGQQLFWAKASTLLIAIYAVLTLLMYLSNKDAATAAKSAAETASKGLALDQRPWLYAEKFALDHEPVFNEPIPISSWMSNSGKTPGLDVVVAEQLKWWNTEPPFPDLEPSLVAAAPKGLVTPGLRQDKIKSETAATNIMARLDEINYYNAGATKLYFFTKMYYCDSLGNRYWTTQCVSHAHSQGLEEFAFCRNGNATGRDAHYKNCPSN